MIIALNQLKDNFDNIQNQLSKHFNVCYKLSTLMSQALATELLNCIHPYPSHMAASYVENDKTRKPTMLNFNFNAPNEEDLKRFKYMKVSLQTDVNDASEININWRLN